MLFVEGQCPYCDEKRGFNLFAVSEYISKRSTKDIRDIRQNITMQDKTKAIAHFYGSGVCWLCKEPVILALKVQDEHLYSMRDCIANHDRVFNGPMPTILAILPQPEPPYSHPALPDDIRKDFVELQKMLKGGYQPHWIIGGCRTVLEMSVKCLGGEGKTLVKRIEDLQGKAIVNGVLADWAHSIRKLGNDAVHDREGTQAEADELVEFTKLFLQYAFEFPARVGEVRKSQAQTKKTTP